jgi:hypothetical protein
VAWLARIEEMGVRLLELLKCSETQVDLPITASRMPLNYSETVLRKHFNPFGVSRCDDFSLPATGR